MKRLWRQAFMLDVPWAEFTAEEHWRIFGQPVVTYATCIVLRIVSGTHFLTLPVFPEVFALYGCYFTFMAAPSPGERKRLDSQRVYIFDTAVALLGRTVVLPGAIWLVVRLYAG